jgi:hypothetical protein
VVEKDKAMNGGQIEVSQKNSQLRVRAIEGGLTKIPKPE